MARFQVGTPPMIVYWLVLLIILAFAFSFPPLFLAFLPLMLAGPVASIPGMLAYNGKSVECPLDRTQIESIVLAVFEGARMGRNWTQVSSEPGCLEFALKIRKPGLEPHVSINLEAIDHRLTLVTTSMTQWAIGGEGGSPFRVWGGYRALAKVNEVSAALVSAPRSSRPASITPAATRESHCPRCGQPCSTTFCTKCGARADRTSPSSNPAVPSSPRPVPTNTGGECGYPAQLDARLTSSAAPASIQQNLSQFVFVSRWEPHVVLAKWWGHFGMRKGHALANPPVPGQIHTGIGLVRGIEYNFELWADPRSAGSVARISTSASSPLGVDIPKVVESIISRLRPPARRAVPAGALSPQSYSWIGSYTWAGDLGRPAHWDGNKVDEVLSTVASGMYAQDGARISDLTHYATWGLIDGDRRAMYLLLPGPWRDDREIEFEVDEGCGEVPASTIDGLQVIRRLRDPFACDISSDGRLLATVELSSGRGYVTLYDLENGTERRLTWVKDMYSGGRVWFSPDNRWLLISRVSRELGPVVIDVETGGQRAFDSIQVYTCWWVHQGHLGLLCIGDRRVDSSDTDPRRVMFFDLTSGEYSEVVRIRASTGVLTSPFPWLTEPAPHADGRILVRGLVPSISSHYPMIPTLCLLDLQSGSVVRVVEPFADDEGYVVRKQSQWHWNSPLKLEVSIAPAILEGDVAPADSGDWPASMDSHTLIRVDFSSPTLLGAPERG